MGPIAAVVGAGELGGAAAHAIAALGCVPGLRLVDPNGSVAAGKALDILQAGALDGHGTHLTGSDDLRSVAGAAVIVIADRAGAPAREWQAEDGLSLLRQIWNLVASDSPVLLFAGASQASLMAAGAFELGITRTRVVGSAPHAWESAIRSLVSLAIDGAGHRAHVMVTGTPDSMLPCWSQATIEGASVASRLSAAQLAAIDARLPRLWPPGPYALGRAAASFVDAIVRGGRVDLTGFVALDGEMGVRRRVGALPVRLGPAGVMKVLEPALTPHERVRSWTQT